LKPRDREKRSRGDAGDDERVPLVNNIHETGPTGQAWRTKGTEALQPGDGRECLRKLLLKGVKKSLDDRPSGRALQMYLEQSVRVRHDRTLR
jgi:hypothetical protein